MGLQIRQSGRVCIAQAVPFSGEHPQELTAPGNETGQVYKGIRDRRPGMGAHRLSKVGQVVGIEPIGLGQQAFGSCEVPNPARADDGYG